MQSYYSAILPWLLKGILVVLLCFSQILLAGNTSNPSESVSSVITERWEDLLKEHNPINQEYVGPVSPKSQVTLPAPPEASSTVDPTVLDAYRTSVREYYIYLENRLKHRQKVFHWQYYSSIVIFFVVIILVGTGIYFAAVQFHHGLKQGGDEKETITQLEATTSGIKISSPVLGVLILIISLVFFYLYLAFVYPINELL